MVEGGGFEPPKLARQIYSLIPLATREPLLQEPQNLLRNLGVLFRGGILGELRCLCNRFTEFFSRLHIGARQSHLLPLPLENHL
mgnify:CR=1 FL=1